jgi:hypothetical protein
MHKFQLARTQHKHAYTHDTHTLMYTHAYESTRFCSHTYVYIYTAHTFMPTQKCPHLVPKQGIHYPTKVLPPLPLQPYTLASPGEVEPLQGERSS